jgi:hypothetical protein
MAFVLLVRTPEGVFLEKPLVPRQRLFRMQKVVKMVVKLHFKQKYDIPLWLT